MPSSQRARVLLLIPHLGGGGAERVTEIVARFLDRRKYEVHLGSISPIGSEASNSIENIHAINASRIRYSPFKILSLIWTLEPDLILSGMAHLNLLVLILRPLLPRRARVFVRQNGEMSATFSTGLHPAILRAIYGFAYRHADLVICQSEGMRREIRRELGVAEAKLIVLHNPVDCKLIRETVQVLTAAQSKDRPHLLAIGRLVPEKGFDILLEAFAGLSARFPEATLTLAGSGPCESDLKRQSRRLGIAHRVHFSGHVSNPARFFRDTSLFVLSSRTEGIPNALLEAASAGLPIVATPASPGLVELLTKRAGVWLASETSASALECSLELALASIKPAERYPHEWIEPFDVGSAVPGFESAIDHAIEEARGECTLST